MHRSLHSSPHSHLHTTPSAFALANRKGDQATSRKHVKHLGVANWACSTAMCGPISFNRSASNATLLRPGLRKSIRAFASALNQMVERFLVKLVIEESPEVGSGRIVAGSGDYGGSQNNLPCLISTGCCPFTYSATTSPWHGFGKQKQPRVFPDSASTRRLNSMSVCTRS
jgi:hypothetical protein